MAYNRERPEGAEVADWDAALRISDRVTNHLLGRREGAWWQWIAVRLADGDAADDALYPTREDAAARQLAPQYMTFLRVTPDGMSPRSAWRYLLMSRQIKGRWKNDFHQAEYVPILPQRAEDARRVFR